MTKFFRGIRQQLTTKGNLKRYLIYAIGEILLVMIGILLALQVNNWNQNRINIQKEEKALIGLLEEFKLNQERIEKKQNKRISLVPKLRKYVELISLGKANYKSFQDYHANQYMIGMTNPSNGVIDALISSGELTLITNDSLKYLLADWKDQLGNLKENEEILWGVTLDYNDYFHQFIIDPNHKWKDWAIEKTITSFNSLKSDVLYRNKLASYEGCQNVIIEECNLVLNSVEKIIRLIETEIKINHH